MYAKLVLRNAKRSTQNYLIYIVTSQTPFSPASTAEPATRMRSLAAA